ncbi:hypothetical protein CMI47_00830 [Candidatus Pacearchaeota archaeon]|nr:hypothetical protein [Candidatus Pacearchaeota archaeon]
MSWKSFEDVMTAGIAIGALTLALRQESSKGSRSNGDDDDDDEEEDDRPGRVRTLTPEMIRREREEHLQDQRRRFANFRTEAIELGDTPERFIADVEARAHDYHRTELRVFHDRRGPNPGRIPTPEHWLEAAYARVWWLRNRHHYKP